MLVSLTQKCVTRSATETGYVALAEITKAVMFMRYV